MVAAPVGSVNLGSTFLDGFSPPIQSMPAADHGRSTAGNGVGAALAEVDGLRVVAGAALARHTTFRIGGPAEWLAEAATASALGALAGLCAERGEPLFLLGLGSNVLIPDEGLEGVVARLVGDLRDFRIEGARVVAGGGVPLAWLARSTARAGLSGLEALSGFPSTVGGAVVMNAGCYGTEVVEHLEWVDVVDRDGSSRRLDPEDLAAGYRTTRLQGSGLLVAAAGFRLRPGDAAESLRRIEELNRQRWASLPSGAGNAGSVFRNPEGDFAGRLIEAVGLKGAAEGGARISPKHANVIVNEGGATARDVLALMVRAHGEVYREHGLSLEPEVVLAGPLRRRWAEAVERVEPLL